MLFSKRLSSQPQLRNVTSAKPLSRPGGSRGDGVATVQGVLADLGFSLTRTMKHGAPDGVFGQETEEAVKSYQRARGLKSDGYVGPLTLAALDADIMARPLALELVDLADEKAQTARQAALPLGARGLAYW